MSIFKCPACGQDLLKKSCEHHPAEPEQLFLEAVVQEYPRDWREELRRYVDDP